MASKSKSGSKLDAKTTVAKVHTGIQKLSNGMLDAGITRFPNISKRNTEKSPLLRLPPELRNRIWAYVLTSERIDLEKFPNYMPLRMCRLGAVNTPHISMLQVCRQIYAEAALLPFTLNNFCFSTGTLGPRWLKSLCSGQKDAIREIEFWCNEIQYCPLIMLPGLRLVHLKHPAFFVCILVGGCYDFANRIKAVFGDGKVEVRIQSRD